jgi:hypothetical protein
MIIYFLISDGHFEDFDDYQDNYYTKKIGKEIFAKHSDNQWIGRYYAKPALRKERTYNCLDEALQVIQNRNIERSGWSIICKAEVSDNYLDKEPDYKGYCASVPRDYQAISLHFHKNEV